jgi:hypothetical protein
VNGRGAPDPCVAAAPPATTPAGWGAPGRRRALQLALAALWLLDAVLQFQTFMFSEGFPRMLAATAAGNPGPVAGPVIWSAHLIGTHPAAATAVFGTVQLLLALGIAWRPAVRAALAASITWALAGWFGWQVLRGGRRGGVTRPGTGLPAPHGHHGAHVLSCTAMVCMLIAAPHVGAPMTARAGATPVVALVLAVAVAISVVVSTDRISALRPAAPDRASARPVLCPRLAASCQIMMGVAMAYMLILLL